MSNRRQNHNEEIKRAVKLALRNAAAGYGAKVALGLVSGLPRLGAKVLAPSRLVSADAARIAGFAGGITALFRAAWLVLEAAGPDVAPFRPFLAGLVSGLPVLFLHKELRRGVAVYVFIRTVYTELSARSGLTPQVADTIVMMTSSIQLTWSFFFEPLSLAPEYLRFLTRFTDREYAYHKLITHGLTHGELPPAAIEYGKKVGVVVTPEEIKDITSHQAEPLLTLLHPETPSDLQFLAGFLRNTIRRAFPLYFPLKLIGLVLGWRKLVASPLTALKKLLISTLQSSLFISAYCMGCWSAIISTLRLNIANQFTLSVAVGAACGSSVLLEPQSRGTELAAYTLSQALRAFYCALVRRKVLPKLPHVEVLLFSLGLALCCQRNFDKSPHQPRFLRSLVPLLTGLKIDKANETPRGH